MKILFLYVTNFLLILGFHSTNCLNVLCVFPANDFFCGMVLSQVKFARIIMFTHLFVLVSLLNIHKQTYLLLLYM